MRNVLLALITLCILSLCGCYPMVWKPQQVPVSSNANTNLRKLGLPDLEHLSCTAPYSCNSAGCPKSQEELNNQMAWHYKWKQVLPEKSMLISRQDGYILRFKWSKTKRPSYVAGQALIISLVTQSYDFSKIKDLGSHSADYMSNLPCNYKVNKYAHFFTKEEFETVLGQHCSIKKETSQKLQLHQTKKLFEEYANQHENRFSIGSMCPGKIQSEKWYFILLKLKPGVDTSTMARIESQLVEDTPQIIPNQKLNQTSTDKLSDCPYLIQSTQLKTKRHHTICGRNVTKVWLNRICLPTKEYVFVPGVDVKNNSKRKAYCFDNTYGAYESGDGDGWFDKRTHTRDVAGNEVVITNNMLLHSTHIGDCHNMNYSNIHTTDKCNWYNVGQISSGKQCYWNKKNNSCYFDNEFTKLFSPEKFLKAYFQESKKQNNYPGSLDRIGRATSWVQNIKNGFVQYLNFGAQGSAALTLNTKKEDEPVRFISYPFWGIYKQRFNDVNGKLGYPMSEVMWHADYMQQQFEFGWIRKYRAISKCYLVKLVDKTPKEYCLKK